ncbi:hypothetical protein JYU34_016226 [Plutella xylostella]|uniref:Uncharacterized protein n=1 Tax=Plutella xylostella TaxID=51655 RepID=A0ABQ7Q251_PLUXY|nr:hypothetical protein JYU34_016226 [Plutella xylostella]
MNLNFDPEWVLRRPSRPPAARDYPDDARDYLRSRDVTPETTTTTIRHHRAITSCLR